MVRPAIEHRQEAGARHRQLPGWQVAAQGEDRHAETDERGTGDVIRSARSYGAFGSSLFLLPRKLTCCLTGPRPRRALGRPYAQVMWQVMRLTACFANRNHGLVGTLASASQNLAKSAPF